MSSTRRVLVCALALLLTCSCAARFYGGEKLTSDRLIRLSGSADLYAVKINNSRAPAIQDWMLLAGEHYVSARYMSLDGWGGNESKTIEFIGFPGRRYVLRAALEDGEVPRPARTPGLLRDPGRIVKWRMWVEDAVTGEVVEGD